jgi:transcription elongation factor Elf1
MGSIQLTCKRCGSSFEFSEGEQRFYHSKGLNFPTYCATCRSHRKQEKEKLERIPSEYITCKSCGRRFEFTARDQQFFRQKGYSKPTTCKSCLQRQKESVSDINDVYNQLRHAMEERHNWGERMNDYWRDVNNGYSRKNEIAQCTKEIGEYTYQIKGLISKLLRFNKRHSAFNLAKSFLESDLERTMNILQKWENTKYDIQYNGTTLIDANGRSISYHDSLNYTNNYLNQLYKRKRDSEEWIGKVSRFTV